jgi:hypothetical protein
MRIGPAPAVLYPLGRAASKLSKSQSGEYFFKVKEAHCLGWQEAKEWTIQAWLADQGLDEYNTMNDSFTDITSPGRPPKRLENAQPPAQLQMYLHGLLRPGRVPALCF